MHCTNTLLCMCLTICCAAGNFAAGPPVFSISESCLMDTDSDRDANGQAVEGSVEAFDHGLRVISFTDS